jgi:hypothetical protein
MQHGAMQCQALEMEKEEETKAEILIGSGLSG